jgi:Dolichyl-phosphate-mannose-protein mannosyltransferase
MPGARPPARPRPWLAPALVALAALACHLAAWDRYGAFRDELYFISCGERLAFGYVDQPPLIALVARAAHGLFGLWVPGLRLLPWIASALTAWATGQLALALGARAPGAALAALAFTCAPVLMGLGHYLTMNAFEPLLFVLLAWTLVRLASGGPPRLWLAAGALAGVGLETKYTMALYAASLVGGLALTTAGRAALRSRWALLGGLLAAALSAPNLAWQAAHGFPFLELVRNGQLHKNAPFTLAGFLLPQLLELNPLNVLVWGPGLLALLLARRHGAARFLGLGFLVLLGVDLLTHAKSYYLAPAFPPLLAAGATAWEAWLAPGSAGDERSVAGGAWRLAVPGLLLAASFAVLAPLALPLRSAAGYASLQATLGIAPHALERHRLGALPQIFADQHGWPELAQAVHEAWLMLPAPERARAVVFAQNYGEASAIELYGAPLGVPPVVSGHNQWFLWGPPFEPEVSLVVSDRDEDCGGFWRSRELLLQLPENPLVMPYESGRSIWVCRGRLRPIGEIWPLLRRYI